MKKFIILVIVCLLALPAAAQTATPTAGGQDVQWDSSPTLTPSSTATPTRTSTPTRTNTVAATNTATRTRTGTATNTVQVTPTFTPKSQNVEWDSSPAPSATLTVTPTRVSTRTVTQTATFTATRTVTRTRTITPTPSLGINQTPGAAHADITGIKSGGVQFGGSQSADFDMNVKSSGVRTGVIHEK